MASANKHERLIPITDPLLLKLVQQKGELVEKGRAISRQQEDLAKQHEKLGDQLTKLAAEVHNKKLDIFKRLEKLAKKELTEYEVPVTTEIRDGKLVLIVSDALAEFKDSFKTFDKFKEAAPRKQKEPKPDK